eukprot:GEMP01015376.1.p1 GENE.GEMP01015376.1~~GEMP01015376.1.p1  ORF type:complete len:670 (-),score=165.41 GEMP01015376.1:305-2314(-)
MDPLRAPSSEKRKANMRVVQMGMQWRKKMKEGKTVKEAVSDDLEHISNGSMEEKMFFIEMMCRAMDMAQGAGPKIPVPPAKGRIPVPPRKGAIPVPRSGVTKASGASAERKTTKSDKVARNSKQEGEHQSCIAEDYWPPPIVKCKRRRERDATFEATIEVAEERQGVRTAERPKSVDWSNWKWKKNKKGNVYKEVTKEEVKSADRRQLPIIRIWKDMDRRIRAGEVSQDSPGWFNEPKYLEWLKESKAELRAERKQAKRRAKEAAHMQENGEKDEHSEAVCVEENIGDDAHSELACTEENGENDGHSEAVCVEESDGDDGHSEAVCVEESDGDGEDASARDTAILRRAPKRQYDAPRPAPVENNAPRSKYAHSESAHLRSASPVNEASSQCMDQVSDGVCARRRSSASSYQCNSTTRRSRSPTVATSFTPSVLSSDGLSGKARRCRGGATRREDERPTKRRRVVQDRWSEDDESTRRATPQLFGNAVSPSSSRQQHVPCNLSGLPDPWEDNTMQDSLEDGACVSENDHEGWCVGRARRRGARPRSIAQPRQHNSQHGNDDHTRSQHRRHDNRHPRGGQAKNSRARSQHGRHGLKHAPDWYATNSCSRSNAVIQHGHRNGAQSARPDRKRQCHGKSRHGDDPPRTPAVVAQSWNKSDDPKRSNYFTLQNR